ncbi:hypothetical protein [Paenibacillus periandrae]|uniref:hypothetical protein n=1 Tax=Paenibacillus periandrae TaxID=1761741 RepID=UPI001F09F8D1|nr:hypothetical protein [Paenibacillus periandrae]
MLSILLGGVGCGIHFLIQGIKLHQIQEEIDHRFSENGFGRLSPQNNEHYFEKSWYRVVALDLNALIMLSATATRVTLIIIFTASIVMGITCGIWVQNNYFKAGSSLLPFSGLSYIIPVLIIFAVMLLPFIFLRAFVQRRRAKLSHQFLNYVEEFERKYLQKYDLYSTMMELTDVLHTGPLKSMTFRVSQAMQRKQEIRLVFELDVFEHQVGSIFATTFFIMFREAYGLDHKGTGRREAKKISMGLRSLIEQMHGYLRVSHQDKPKKKEIVQVGFFAFPLLYGAYYFALRMMGEDGTRKFMFESVIGSTLFIGSIFFGFMAIVVNLIISRRKFDL